MTNEMQNDPMEFFKGMWGNMGFSLPGMVTPTLDTDELGKRITDLKAVEGWLKSNLGLLQMTIQGMEMQRATLAALEQMRQATQDAAADAESTPNPFLNPANWQMPWNLMTGAGDAAGGAVPPAPTSAAPAAATPAPAKPKRSRKKSQPEG